MNTVSDSKKSKRVVSWMIENSTFIVLIAMIIICAALTSNFYQWQNISNLLKQNAGIGIIAMGMLFVILTGGIDLSVGSITGMCNVIVAALLFNYSKMTLEMAIFVTFLTGVGMGAVNGYFVAFRKLPPFVVTLATMSIGRGFAYIISKGAPIIVKHSSIENLGRGTFLMIPNQFWITIVVFVVTLLVLRYTSYGRIVKAVGSNEEAVRLSGLRVNTYKFSVYAIVGFLCAVAGVMGTARTGVGSPLFGEGYELDAIAMVVIGGASLNGGRGTAVKTLAGVFIMGMISNIMNLVNVPAYTQRVVMGLIILGAVFLQSDFKRNKS